MGIVLLMVIVRALAKSVGRRPHDTKKAAPPDPSFHRRGADCERLFEAVGTGAAALGGGA
ncbi:MAG: hypothetical protein CMJ58_01890 [Planctomycetaceae bacterium]|nr:hypothetical protein [Planctomycetaceae bacterium]